MFDPTAHFYDYFPSGYLIGLIDFFVLFTAYQQDILYTSICLNRFTAVWQPFLQQTRWNKSFKWHILFSLIMPIPLTIHLLFARGKYLPIEKNNPGIEKIPILLNFDLWELNSNIVTIVLNSICLIACFCLNIATFIKIKQIKKQNPISIIRNGNNLNNKNSRGGISKVEINLIIMTVVMTAMLMTSLLYQVLLYSLRNGNFLSNILSSIANIDKINEIFWNQLPWVNDLRALSHPWLLILLCDDVRQKSFEPLLSKTWKTPVQSIQLQIDQMARVKPTV
ncbi:Serpentine receptor class gamma [Meloidogyne graminicola]|uniref:Serpentine receptor class gamma n=1 Tax=Meloidogyne graminicola TaxID=189291 RepID=A0A8S9ZF20_9BILA|nr:Serpentine receptor class gamma [Meloidogyne graminicola]